MESTQNNSTTVTIAENEIFTVKDLNAFIKSFPGTKKEKDQKRKELFLAMSKNCAPSLAQNIKLAESGIRSLSKREVVTKNGTLKEIFTFTQKADIQKIEYVRVPKEKAIEAGIYTPKEA